MRPDRPLAARFDEVDAAGGVDGQVAYLDAQAATSFWRERKRESLSLLDLAAGMACLDVGCGTGEEVRKMARLVAPEGRALGVDASRALIKEAQSRSSTDEAVEFKVADAASLPFDDASFDAVRCERVLQHVSEPAVVVAEMARVARPGAAIVAIEPDWDTLAVDGEPFDVMLAVCRAWADAIRQPRAGRTLPAWFAEAGLERVEPRTATSVMGSLAFAMQQFELDALVRGAVDSGEISRSDGDAWLADLGARDEAGTFVASVTYVTARGYAPGERGAAPALPQGKRPHRKGTGKRRSSKAR